MITIKRACLVNTRMSSANTRFFKCVLVHAVLTLSNIRNSVLKKKATNIPLSLAGCLSYKNHMRANCCWQHSWKCQTLLPICHSVHYEQLCSAHKRGTSNSTLFFFLDFYMPLLLLLLRQSKECNNLCVAKYCYILFNFAHIHSYKYTQSYILVKHLRLIKTWSFLEFSKLILNNGATSRLCFS